MIILSVSGMGCGSCVMKITRGIQALDSDARVVVSREAGQVEVDSVESATVICQIVNSLGYPAQVIR